MTEAPSPFSAHNPRLQLAWDSTSFRALMVCPRYYQYTILEGYRWPGSIDLEFGGFYASSVETYKKSRLTGASKAAATRAAVRYAIENTWDPVTGPWSGRYENLWRCTGTEKYKNRKGNAAKCPWSHKGALFPPPAPDVCGECGSPTETSRVWVSQDRAKDRPALIRMVIWWCDEQPERAEDGSMPFLFPDGTPAVELGLALPLPHSAPTGERYILCGYLDAMEKFGAEGFIVDNKTTKKMLNKQYWKQYSPNIQVDSYDLLGTTLFPDMDLSGVRIDAAQAMVGGARFGTQVFYRTDAQREEFLGDLRYWLTQAEGFAEKGHWPMNRAACAICPFSGVCSKTPERREAYLKENFEVRHWNPLQQR